MYYAVDDEAPSHLVPFVPYKACQDIMVSHSIAPPHTEDSDQ